MQYWDEIVNTFVSLTKRVATQILRNTLEERKKGSDRWESKLL